MGTEISLLVQALPSWPPPTTQTVQPELDSGTGKGTTQQRNNGNPLRVPLRTKWDLGKRGIEGTMWQRDRRG